MSRLSSILAVFSSRGRFLVFMNLLFFGGVFVVVLGLDLLLPPSPFLGLNEPFPVMFETYVPLMVLAIFFFNLVVSAFVVVSLPGAVFFPLSAGFLLYRAVLWGLLLHYQPSWVLLVALPTLVLEGEAYVFAAVAGTTLGVSWIKPRWVYEGEDVTRGDAFKRAWGDFLRLYVFVVVLLFVAAVVEVAILIMMQ